MILKAVVFLWHCVLEWTNFPSTFCKRTRFQSAFFNEDEFSLGPVFIEPPFSLSVSESSVRLTCGWSLGMGEGGKKR